MAPSARKRDRRRMSRTRRPLEQLSLGRILDPSPVSPLISTRNLVPGLSSSVVKLDKLGKGATSNVFRAVHAATLKMVALKEVVVSTAADRRAVRTEMRTLVTQRSPLLTSTFTTELAACPRIVEFYGSVVTENGNACIAVEYVAGGSLENWLESGCGCPEPWIAHIGHQALEALEFLRGAGRVHRDVKPANLLITRRGDLKLADFGAAGVENSLRMVGTQRFMAPERLDGGPATEKSDLWALGLSLATAALGENPISQASNEFAQLSLAIRAQRTIKRETELSPNLVDFLCRCLAPDPARRPALRELMHHSFLKQRCEWQSKCPEVARAMRARKRRQREDSGALGTEAVLQALCRARAEDNLKRAPLDTSTAADLAYELGVTSKSLIRAVQRRTSRLSGIGGGGEAGCRRVRHRAGCVEPGVRDTCEECDGSCEGVNCRIDVGEEGFAHGCYSDDSDRGLSPMYSPPLGLDGEAIEGPAPIATVVGCSPAGSIVLPAWTPRTPCPDLTPCTPRHAFTPRTPRVVPTPRVSGLESARTPGRRVREVSSSVKLTPHKRRHELKRRSSRIKLEASHRTARKERKERLLAERELEHKREDECGDEGKSGREEKHRGAPNSVHREKKVPMTAVSRMIPRRSDVMKSTRDFYRLADLMKSEIKVKDRIHRFRVYKGCFSGREAVQWMIDGGHASSLNEALTLGNEMMQSGVFAHIMNSHLFEDSSVYYQFTDGKPPPPPASGGRRFGQVARVVVKKIVKGVVGSKSGDEFEASLQEIVSKASASAQSDCGGVTSRQSSNKSTSSQHNHHARNKKETATPTPTASIEETEGTSVASIASNHTMGKKLPVHRIRPPRMPSSSLERKQSRRFRHGAGGPAAAAVAAAAAAGSTVSQLRRFSSSISTATVPETPY